MRLSPNIISLNLDLRIQHYVFPLTFVRSWILHYVKAQWRISKRPISKLVTEKKNIINLYQIFDYEKHFILKRTLSRRLLNFYIKLEICQKLYVHVVYWSSAQHLLLFIWILFCENHEVYSTFIHLVSILL